MSAATAFAPVARPHQAATMLLGMRPVRAGVIARAVPVAFALRPDPPVRTPVHRHGAASAAGRYGAGDRGRWADGALV